MAALKARLPDSSCCLFGARLPCKSTWILHRPDGGFRAPSDIEGRLGASPSVLRMFNGMFSSSYSVGCLKAARTVWRLAPTSGTALRPRGGSRFRNSHRMRASGPAFRAKPRSLQIRLMLQRSLKASRRISAQSSTPSTLSPRLAAAKQDHDGTGAQPHRGVRIQPAEGGQFSPGADSSLGSLSEPRVATGLVVGRPQSPTTTHCARQPDRRRFETSERPATFETSS